MRTAGRREGHLLRPDRPLVRISCKNLGGLALPNPCLRCFWLCLHLQFRLPFAIFPGIFSSIDALTKRVVYGWFESHRELPRWLEGLGAVSACIPPPHYSRFNILDAQRAILLTGAPDAVFCRADGSLIICDFKTAKWTATQDELFPLYCVQLNGYARIGKVTLGRPVSQLALVYCEPVTEGEVAIRRCSDFGFDMGFTAHVLDMPLDLSSLDPLLDETRRLFDLPSPPEGRPSCKDCRLLEEIVIALTAPRSRRRI